LTAGYETRGKIDLTAGDVAHELIIFAEDAAQLGGISGNDWIRSGAHESRVTAILFLKPSAVTSPAPV
jgi:hypothetical protein